MNKKMFYSSNEPESIDLHGVRHRQALEKVNDKLREIKRNGSFSLVIITGNSSVLQNLIIDEILKFTNYNYYIPSWNLGQIIVDFVEL